MRNAVLLSLVLVLALGAGEVVAAGERGDPVVVLTFDHDFYNWATPHEQTFNFPPLDEAYEQVLLYYTIECPGPPGDCDPWDRLGYLQVLRDEPGVGIVPYEIARIITPYDITGGSYPGSCTWMLDVTDYRFLLHDEVTLSNYIETWMGDDRGWIVTITFEFYPGVPELEAYRVENLWRDYRVVYGEPADPIEDHLQPTLVGLDPETVAAKLRSAVTGHGQGNTDNAAEFSNKWHEVVVNGNQISHQLWRSDCHANLCSPQGGTWWYSRAGWCPGDKVDPWDVDITEYITPGGAVDLDYNVQPYENFCRPTNPDCIDGTTCPDCDYNYSGHTEPHYAMAIQLILYREHPLFMIFENGFESGDFGGWSSVVGQ
jgi:hypothetical protein